MATMKIDGLKIDGFEKLKSFWEACRDTGKTYDFGEFVITNWTDLRHLSDTQYDITKENDITKEIFPEWNDVNRARIRTILNVWEKSSGFNSTDTSFIMSMLMLAMDHIPEVKTDLHLDPDTSQDFRLRLMLADGTIVKQLESSLNQWESDTGLVYILKGNRVDRDAKGRVTNAFIGGE